MESAFSYLVNFLTGKSILSAEMQSFWMAIQGSMMIRKGKNSKRDLHWFHAFCLSVMAGFAGGWLGFFLMGKPTAMYYNDLNMASCIIGFAIVNFTPYDIGYKLMDSLPLTLITVSFAQLFRSTAIPKFVNVCYETFKDNPSRYYPIPVFGPIMHATLLGNFGGIFTKGLEGHVENGMPWPIQNGIFCASFFHFYANDKTGPIGSTLRKVFPLASMLGLDDQTFAISFVSLFMQIVGVLQIPAFLGPSFSPFDIILSRWKDVGTWKVGQKGKAASEPQQSKVSDNESAKSAAKKRKKKKPKSA